MVRTSEVCYACGSHSVPKGARFCPACGSALAPTTDNAVPMVPAVPVEASDTVAASAPATTTASSSASAPTAPPVFETTTAPTTRSAADSTMSPMTGPVVSITQPIKDPDVETATFWKNPTPAMLKHATEYQPMGGILFISSSGRKGKFTVPRTIHVGQILTGERIDLSIADFVYPVTTISVGTILGGIKVVVPRGVRVETHGLGILGGFKGIKSQTVNAGQVENAPLVVVQGLSILGGAKVTVNHDVPPVQVIP